MICNLFTNNLFISFIPFFKWFDKTRKSPRANGYYWDCHASDHGLKLQHEYIVLFFK